MLNFGIHHEGAAAVAVPAGTAASGGNPLVFVGMFVGLIVIIYGLYWLSKQLFKN